VCTCSWLIRPTGFELFFNRDEARTRGEASGPEPGERDGVRYLAPRDADAGGTWIGVNEHGLALCLLNAWHLGGPRPAGEYRSRGLLVRELLVERSVTSVREALRRVEVVRYRGFSLAAFATGAPPVRFDWDGERLEEREARQPLSSSSFDAAGAEEARGKLLASLGQEGARDRAQLLAFHRSHAPERGPLSPCMHRPDARTVSSSHLVVECDAVRFAYAAGPPCRSPYAESVVLARRAVLRDQVPDG